MESKTSVIFQIDCYRSRPPFVALTRNTVASYAARIGADHVVFVDGEPLRTLAHVSLSCPYWYKFGLIPYFLTTGYDKMMFLDLDILVRNDAPNLFDRVENSVVCSSASSMMSASTAAIADIARKRGLVSLADRLVALRYHLNTGLFAMDRGAAQTLVEFLIPPDMTIRDKREQGCLTYKFMESGVKITILEKLLHANPFVHESFEQSYFWHLNGPTQRSIPAVYADRRSYLVSDDAEAPG